MLEMPRSLTVRTPLAPRLPRSPRTGLGARLGYYVREQNHLCHFSPFCFHCSPAWRHLLQLASTPNTLHVLAGSLVYTLVGQLHTVGKTRFVNGLTMLSRLPVFPALHWARTAPCAMSQRDRHSNRNSVQHKVAHPLVMMNKMSIPEMRMVWMGQLLIQDNWATFLRPIREPRAVARQAPGLRVLAACTPLLLASTR